MEPYIAKIRSDLGIGQESKVSVNADLERLKGRRSEEESSSLNVIGINELANAFVRLVSNLNA